MSNWTPTTQCGYGDTLPEKSGKYLVTYLTSKGKRHVEERWFYSQYGGFTKGNGRIIAWMPMPEPYNETMKG